MQLHTLVDKQCQSVNLTRVLVDQNTARLTGITKDKQEINDYEIHLVRVIYCQRNYLCCSLMVTIFFIIFIKVIEGQIYLFHSVSLP